MTNQDKIKYLKQYRTNELETTRLQEELVRWDSKACKVTTGFSSTPAGGAGADKIQLCVEKIVEIQNQLTAQMIAGADLRSNIGSAIDSVPDIRLRQLLRYRYIDGMTWERVAVSIGCSWQNTHKMHRKALQLIVCDSQPML